MNTRLRNISEHGIKMLTLSISFSNIMLSRLSHSHVFLTFVLSMTTFPSSAALHILLNSSSAALHPPSTIESLKICTMLLATSTSKSSLPFWRMFLQYYSYCLLSFFLFFTFSFLFFFIFFHLFFFSFFY